MKLTTFALLMLVTASNAQAQQIYKCVQANGTSAYQQAPCGPSAKTKGVRSYIPVPDSKPQPNFRRVELPIAIEAEEPEAIYQPPPQALPERPSRFSDPQEFKDQYGNKYVERPDSSFVKDKRTGKLCFRYGSEKQFLNCK